MMLHVLGHELQGVAVAGDDERLPALGFGLAGQRRQDVVGLVARHRQVDEPERLRSSGQVGPLLGQQVGHGLALRLVVLELLVAEGLLRASQATITVSGRYSARILITMEQNP